MSRPTIHTPLTKMLGIDTPVLLAGMNGVSHCDLAAAVTNGGGLGVIGGLTMTPKVLREEITELKSLLTDPNGKFGVDLAIPQVGGSARKTNHDYTHGHLPELIDIIVEEGAALFVCAVGIPPRWAVDKLHAGGVLVMNMVGHPQHVLKAINAGVDLICAQGTEGGGHTGDVATMPLIPQAVDICKGHVSPYNGEPIRVVAAGGIFDGRGVAASLSLGAVGVWVGTRFICAEEAAAGPKHQNAVLKAQSTQTVRTLIYSGRPLRVYESDYVKEWNNERADEIKKLCDQGILPNSYELGQAAKEGREMDPLKWMPDLMGQAAGAIHEILPAAQIIEDMMVDACRIMNENSTFVTSRL